MEKVTVDWANEAKNIIVVTYQTNDWEWTDMVHAFEKQRALMDQTPAVVVHVIVDVIRSQLVPKGGNLLTMSRNLSRDVHPKQGHTIIVGARGILAKMLEITEKFLGTQRSKIHTTTILPAAYDIIAKLPAETNQ